MFGRAEQIAEQRLDQRRDLRIELILGDDAVGAGGDAGGAVILAGLGVAELSMSIPSVAAVKARLRRSSYAQATALAKQALACTTADEVRQLALAWCTCRWRR